MDDRLTKERSAQIEQALRHALRDLPLASDHYHFKAADEQRLLGTLFDCASGHGKYLSYFFPNNDQLARNYKMHDEKDSTVHINRPCCRKFLRGEPTYRCQTCAVDETCALCSYCFNPDDHVGHAVSINTSLKETGGVCDCGDPEAWIKPLNCKSSKKIPPSAPLPNDLLTYISVTIGVALDYVLDVIVSSPQPGKNMDLGTILSDDVASVLDPNVYGHQDVPTHDMHSLVLWNDEKHSFQDVINRVTAATKRRTEFGVQVATTVNDIGRMIVMSSSNFDKLSDARAIFNMISLATTIRARRDIYREEMAFVIIKWLHDLAASPLNGNYFVLRSLISTSLLCPWRPGSMRCRRTRLAPPLIPDDLLMDSSDDSEDNTFVPPRPVNRHPSSSSNLASGPDSQPESSDYSKQQHIVSLEPLSAVSGIAMHVEPECRLDFFFLFDVRLWKQFRQSLSELYISTLGLDTDSKAALADRFTHLYPDLLQIYLVVDREPDYSVLSLSTQLFTTPSIASHIVSSGMFCDFLVLLYNFCSAGKISTSERLMKPGAILDIKALRNRRFGQVFHDVEYILTRNSKNVYLVTDKHCLKLCTQLLLLFQGAHPVIREKEKHIEYESDQWVIFFNLMPPLLHLSHCVSNGMREISLEEKIAVLRYAYSVIAYWLTNDQDSTAAELKASVHNFATLSAGENCNSYSIVQYKVDSEAISFHHPAHAFLSWLIQEARLPSPSALLQCFTYDENAIQLPLPSSFTSPLLRLLVLDYPLRVLVFLAQIRTGLWVRNGYSIRTQHHHYREVTLREMSFSRDVFMVQSFMAACSPSEVALTFLDRWELIPFVLSLGKRESLGTETTVYDASQLPYILDEFLHSLIFLVCERTNLLGLDEESTKTRLIEGEIIQSLCFGPSTFSEFVKRIPDSLIGDGSFDRILEKVSYIKHTQGANDKKLYCLKPEYYAEASPFYIHYSPFQREEADQAIKKGISDFTGKSVDSVIIEPKLESLAGTAFENFHMFLQTQEMANFIFSVLAYVVKDGGVIEDKLDATFNAALHVCHIALICAQSCLDELTTTNFALLSCATIGKDTDWASIFDILHAVVSNNKNTQWIVKINRLLDLIRECAPEAIAECEDKYAVQPDVPVESEDSGAEDFEQKRKRMAKERQMKAMADLARQQAEFANSNMIDWDDDSDMEDTYHSDTRDGQDLLQQDVEPWQFPVDPCILCRKPVSVGQLYGYVGLITGTSYCRRTPFSNDFWLKHAIEREEDFDSVKPYVFAKADAESVEASGFPRDKIANKEVAVSCGHILHYECYSEYYKSTRTRSQQINRNYPDNSSLNQFLCPLCQSLNNMFFPVLWSNIYTTFESLRDAEPDLASWISSSRGQVRELIHSLVPETDNSGPDLFENINLSFERNLHSVLDDKHIYDPQKVDNESNEEEDEENLQSVLSLPLSRENISSLLINKLLTITDTFLYTGVPTGWTSNLKNYDSRKLLSGWGDVYLHTMSSLEVSLRDINRDSGDSLLDQINDQSYTLIRTLRQSCMTVLHAEYKDAAKQDGSTWSQIYTTFNKGGFEDVNSSHIPILRLLILLFPEHKASLVSSAASFTSRSQIVQNMLKEDSFGTLTYCSIYLVEVLKMDYHSILSLCYFNEILRVILWYSLSFISNSRPNIDCVDVPAKFCEKVDELDHIRTFLGLFRTQCPIIRNGIDEAAARPELLNAILYRCTTAFLRKAAILTASIGAAGMEEIRAGDGDEHQRLCALLNLPYYNKIIGEINKHFTGTTVDQFYKGLSDRFVVWLDELAPDSRSSLRSIMETHNADDLPYFGVHDTLALPEFLHDLVKIIMTKECKNCGKQPYDPGICLFCGSIVCFNSFCCLEGGEGECMQHIRTCGRDVGIYLIVKRCSLLFLRKNQGTFAVAPYFDVHGETDQNMRWGRPHYLSPAKYKSIVRDAWLKNQIGNVIARKLELVLDTGGWNTL
ncbi:hypothetical protein CANCADRAFT_31924 [Tortispora caseinolytica NRRL Y-17796]|uniref:E3 ubiquitin-protein ligase n=1 Tax=Tortispora caseinolytica NRRL Y-17796 TaxID=767744 RepID=A0A1E4THJ5_9ASCO|nr:hypothetical protein CANCADRAFT_31924 [Tortispora caseinolytica NRRL Y-17796]